MFLCYGSYANLELLELYGFLLDHNPHDKVGLFGGSKTLHGSAAFVSRDET